MSSQKTKTVHLPFFHLNQTLIVTQVWEISNASIHNRCAVISSLMRWTAGAANFPVEYRSYIVEEDATRIRYYISASQTSQIRKQSRKQDGNMAFMLLYALIRGTLQSTYCSTQMCRLSWVEINNRLVKLVTMGSKRILILYVIIIL